MTTLYKPVVHIEELGEQARLPDGGVINAGGVVGPTFTVGGRGLLFDDGTSTGGGSGPGPNPGGGITGGLFFVNAAPTSTGIVGSKVFAAGTTPANKVLTEATTDTASVTLTLLAEGPSTFYSPVVTIECVPPQSGGPIICSLVEDTFDKRLFHATAELVGIAGETVVTATSTTGATATLLLHEAAAPPVFSTLLMGPYPGLQTAVKAGDILTVTGSVVNSAVYAELLGGGANSTMVVLTLGAVDSAGPGLKTVSGSFTVSGLSGLQTVAARAQNSLGSFGGAFTSQNNRLLDQVYPTIGARTIVYPLGQQALKNSEAASVSATVTNFDSILYTGTNLSIDNPTVYAVTKTATRTGGSYSYNVQNYTITATRAANGAVSTASSAISIANDAPQAAITIVGNPARLFSSPAGTDYTITITANQRLLSAPSLSASSGTWQGAGWSGSGTTWTRVLRILDTSPKGPQLFSSLSLVGLAGIPGSVISSGAAYIVGGFITRTITFPAFARYHAIGTSIVDFSKVTAAYTGSTVLARRSDTNDVFQSFTIVDSAGNFDPNGSYLFISDAAFAGSNTSGTLQLDVAEAA